MMTQRGGGSWRLVAGAIAVLTLRPGSSAAGPMELSGLQGPPDRPFTVAEVAVRPDAIQVELTAQAYAALKDGPAAVILDLPISAGEHVKLSLQRFDVIARHARFVSASAGGRTEMARPDVAMFRGQAVGDRQSHAFLAFSRGGLANGNVTLADGRRYILSSGARPAARGQSGLMTIHRESDEAAVPEFLQACGLDHNQTLMPPRMQPRSAALLGAPRVAFVAVDTDFSYLQLFDDEPTAAAYIVQLIGAVSDIYIRDLDVKLVLAFARTWPNGDEPFAATDLGGFESYWNNNEDTTGLNLIHMFSGRRDTGYGGVANLSNPCGSDPFAISAFLLGSFPSPVIGQHLGNWDLTVVAHEMGHNMGTLHTHDGYTPPIDQCGSAGIHARSDIMSYCHTTAGGLLNIDPRFHARVQEVIATNVALGDCLWSDCNGNGASDTEDILLGASDVNGNGVPDECEDCNNNGILNSVEIAGGAADLDANGIPDLCEPDCNGNTFPDEYDIANSLAADANGNLIPDGCEADCDANGTADHVQIATGASPDLDRNTVPDSCQDCNSNGLPDYIDMDRQYGIFVADLADFVREFHQASGVGVRNLASGIVADPYDLTFGPDRALYVASFGNDRIVRIDINAGTASVFVPTGSGGLDGPSGVIFGANGNLLVTSRLNSRVLEFDGSSGTFVGVFVPAGSGGLTGPYGLTLGPNGDLFVACSDNQVRQYSGANGSFVGLFVGAANGGLSGPRGLVFKPDGKLLVASTTNSRVLEYSPSGAFLRIFTDAFTPTGAWGIRIGPNGNVFVVRNTGTVRVLEFDINSGIYIRSFIRADSDLVSPTGLAFAPASPNDCNANSTPDDCEPDTDGDGLIDPCDICPTIAPPSIVKQPSGVAVCQGEPATLAVTASGTTGLGYQWRLDGKDIPGATSSTYSIAAAAPGDTGDYDVVVTDDCGSRTSDTVTLVVVTPAECVDGDQCTSDSCAGGACQHTATPSAACDDGDSCTENDTCPATIGPCAGTPVVILYGDVAPSGGDDVIDLNDILCVLDGFGIAASCPDGDIAPCEGDGQRDLNDILAILDAFTGVPSCPHPCPP